MHIWTVYLIPWLKILIEVDLETSPGSYWGTLVDNDPESGGCIFNYVY